MNSTQKFLGALAMAAALTSCGDGGTGPEDGGFSVAAQTGETQFGVRGSALADPLQVVVTDPVSKTPQDNVAVTWRVVSGSATLSATSTFTTTSGIASVTVLLGTQLGTSVIEASVPNLVGEPARFTVRAVDAPAITSVAPATAAAGAAVTITGQNFSTVPDENAVLFGGFRARVTAATATQLTAVVPLCIPSRTVNVRAMLGAVGSNELPVAVTGTTASATQLARGESRLFSDANELACFRLPGGVAGLSVLLIPQNASQVVGSFSSFQLAGLTGSTVATSLLERPVTGTTDAATEWETRLRHKERELMRSADVAFRPQMSAQAAACPPAPKVGDRCDFQVINKDDKFDRVTAETKAVSTRAIIYQDINTSASNGLSAADFNALAAVFDDPIYAADVAAFGTPSDIDGNGKVIILLTPVVNALTPRSSSGFIAGFFYGCDLLSRSSCSGSNESEIFYALTTDPTGQFGDSRSKEAVMRALPPVLAHEFQHMINFAQRNKSTDALWLSEGMAHHAEDVVADAFAQRGDLATAASFRAQNTLRANRYLRATSFFSLISEDDVSSLEMRGAAWLFVKYLESQFGSEILAKITRSTQSSVANVTTQTGRAWSSLLSDWAAALWLDDAPELQGVTLRKELTFPNINLRQRFVNTDGSYPLKPAVYGFSDFIEQGTLQASTQAYVLVRAGTGTSTQLNLTFAGTRGGPFGTNAVPQITAVRVN